MKIDYSSFETVEDFKYLGTILTNNKAMHEEFKSGLQAENVCYYSVQNLLRAIFLTKNISINIYITFILPVVFYGCKIWSHTMREERRQRVYENRVLRRIFGPKRDGATMEWTKPYNEELNDLYSSPNIFRVMKSGRIRWAGHVARMGEGKAYTGSWWGNQRGKIPLGRPRRKWEENIKTGLQSGMWGVWTRSSCLRRGAVGGHLGRWQ